MKSSGWALFTIILTFLMIISESNSLKEILENSIGFLLTILLIIITMKLFFNAFPFFRKKTINQGIEQILHEED